MKVTNSQPRSSITFNTRESKPMDEMSKWWLSKNENERCESLLATAAYLKENQNYRQRQTALYARLYGNMSLYNFIGSNIQKLDQTQGLPIDRPTFNVIQSAADTLISKLTQSRPAPVFLTDNSDYKERNLAKKLNNFILGEFYQTKAYDKARTVMRDCLVTGTGALKIYKTEDGKVGLERVLQTELLNDPSESIYGEPRQMYQLKLVDRSVLLDNFPKYREQIEIAAKAFPDNSADSSKSVADQVLVVEGWHLPSGKNAKDGRHTIACSSGCLVDEKYTKDRFPFVFLHYSPRLLGFWAQGLAEQLIGTQLEINSLLYTISKAIKLVGVPRIFQEAGSKVTKAAHNNDIGVIIEYRGTKPSYEVAQCVPEELYAQLQRLIQYAYQQCGVSALDASAQKPAGLNSGEAIRTYDDISTDRFADLARRFDNFHIDLAYAIIDQAKEIAEDEGSYATVFPNKNGIKEIDLTKADLLKDPFVIQCFNQSSLPKDPAGRLQKITEMIQAGMLSIREGRRLLDYPDLDQTEKLANAAEERILQILDEIVESGQYTPPDPFMDADLGMQLSVQYINLYSQCKLEEEKQQKLRTFFSQCQMLKQAAQPPPPVAPQAMPPQAQPQPLPQSPLVPNANPGQ